MALEADTVQSVVFVEASQPQDDALRLWQAIFPDDSPDGYQKATALPTLMSTASGIRENVSVHLAVQVGRIDVACLPSGNPSLHNGKVRSAKIADMRAASATLERLVRRLVEKIEATRMAVVIDTSATVDTSGPTDILKGLLPSVRLPENSSDVIFQLNVRKYLPSVEIEINRLCTWSTGEVQFISAGTGGLPPIVRNPIVSMKADVNTVPEVRLSREQTIAVVPFLVEEALSLVSEQGRGLGI